MVWVEPPLNRRPLGSNPGLTLSPMVKPLAPVLIPNPHEASSEMLPPPLTILLAQFPPGFAPRTVPLTLIVLPKLKMPTLLLPENVLLATLSVPNSVTIPPPTDALLPEKVLLVMLVVVDAIESMPPPATAVLPEKVLLDTISPGPESWPELKTPPPGPAGTLLPEKLLSMTESWAVKRWIAPPPPTGPMALLPVNVLEPTIKAPASPKMAPPAVPLFPKKELPVTFRVPL